MALHHPQRVFLGVFACHKPGGVFATAALCAFGFDAANAQALALARSKLEGFAKNPERHARYGTKVLLKFKLLEWGRISKAEFSDWALQVPYMNDLHRRFGQGHTLSTWIDMMLAELERSGALEVRDGILHDA